MSAMGKATFVTYLGWRSMGADSGSKLYQTLHDDLTGRPTESCTRSSLVPVGLVQKMCCKTPLCNSSGKEFGYL
jgi:hypothetical protein